MGEKNGGSIFEIFFRKKPAMMLVLLKNNAKSNYGSILSKETDCTYSHVVNILNEMRKGKLVTFERQGRTKTIKLTETGIKVATNIEQVMNLLKV